MFSVCSTIIVGTSVGATGITFSINYNVIYFCIVIILL